MAGNTTKPSSRINKQTPKAVDLVSTGRAKTKRSTIDTGAPTDITFPPRIKRILFRNAGVNDVRIRVNNTGNQFFTLEPGDRVDIAVYRSTVTAQAFGAATDLECLFEG
jgi:hypothetical protein